jgi:hypothetical protein
MVRRFASSSAAAVVIAVGLTATLTTGISYASLKTHGAKACLTKTGELRLATARGKCPHGDSKVTVSGPGAKGAPGARGATGPVGPSHALSYTYPLEVNLDQDQTANVGGTATPLPAGDYFVSATVVAENGSLDQMNTHCTLYSNTDRGLDGHTVAFEDAGFTGGLASTPMILQGTLTVTVATDLEIGCYTLGSNTPEGDIMGTTQQGETTFNAIRVGSVN